MDVLHVDCGTCIARGAACSDCVVTVLLGASGGVVDLDQDERAALEALAEATTSPKPAADAQLSSRRPASGSPPLLVVTRR